MKILITGHNGFVGKNLVAELNNRGYNDLYLFDRETPYEQLEEWTKTCDFVFHLAGINRPENDEEFMEGNAELTSQLTFLLKKNNNLAPIMLSSSIQAERDNPYGRSKKAGEDYLLEYSSKNNLPVYIYRFANLFGKWSRPNYNTVIATFCYNIARNLEITVDDPSTEITFQYIDDVVDELINCLEGKPFMSGDYYDVQQKYKRSLGYIVELINSFKQSRVNRLVPDLTDEFTKKLYSTYTSFLHEEDFSYDLVMHKDNRGSFTEFIKSPYAGQVSINVSKPGITRGQHWHNTKFEKFLVVSGTGVVRFRKINTDKIIEYPVSAEKLEVVDIPVGYVHSIFNVGETDLITVMWVNELYDPNDSDTHPKEV